jgi:hypothetical protein
MKEQDANQIKAAQTDIELDQDLQQLLADFRSSVHAWSDATVNSPRFAQTIAHRPFWHPAVSWALAAVLTAGTLSGGLYHRHRQQVSAARAAEQQRLVEEQRARQEEEKLLARIDKDVSRQVPRAMEPLAELMDAEDLQ